ncbi:RxLR effector protein [Phytophthora megakarya]|uniref:RxLR effector protein n=1 Tax=Phytophthora megakarya TaxID=4795 RepID=A0A225VXM2_9STRA|nr:RxLR effector protein [Phytophthora megakarya]
MRLLNRIVVVLAVVLLTGDTAVSNADQTSVSNVNVIHTSYVQVDEGKRFLRSHPTKDEEERKNGAKLLSALKIQKAQQNTNYRVKLFRRWKKHKKSAADLEDDIPRTLNELYAAYRRIYG